MELTIEDLLNALNNPNDKTKTTLENNKDTWNRIGKKDVFFELGLEPSALETYISEWISNNPYNNI